jgi:nicotinamidase-related amidase
VSFPDADLDRFALLVVDVQRGFADSRWGQRNNPACEDNIALLLRTWREHRRPVVFVRHDSSDPGSPLHPGQPGNEFAATVTGEADLLVTKTVNSGFHGSPDLHAWLRDRDLAGVVITGVTTNHCCETTARVGGNLGHRVLFALDATHTFDRRGPDGRYFTADDLASMTAANLDGEFATVVSTAQLLAASGAGH